jgi:hypothetical protein
MANPNDININVQVNGLAGLNALSAGLRNINATLKGSAQGAASFDARQRSLNTALGVGKDGAKAHAKSLTEVIRNQSALGNELRRSTSDYKALTSSQVKSTNYTRQAAAQLGTYNGALKGIKARVLVSDLSSLAYQMKKTGKEAQWTGRQLMTGLTLPILAFGRIALGSFAAVDKELTKLDKILEDVSMTVDRALIKMQVAGETATERLGNASAKQIEDAKEAVKNFKDLENTFTDLARTFGDNKSLVISLGVDFAQLGLNTNRAVTSLTEAVLMAEKLGDVDISQGKDLIQTIYFQATKMLDTNATAHDDVKSAIERENAALAVVNGTLAQFNLIENTTVLSLNDIAKALPEAGAAATQFGLSMVETMGLLAPMKAAGFDVASSANAIKVSLQRLNDPTEESRDMLASLTEVLGFDFMQATHIGVNSIDYLAQAFNNVKNTAAGAEGAMEFMTQLFVLRQGPRMAESIADIAEFNDQLAMLDQTGNTSDKSLQKIVETANRLKTEGSVVPLIKGYSDLGNIARISTMHLSRDTSKNVIELIENGRTVTKTITEADKKEAQAIRTAVGDVVLDARRDGTDLIATINSQVGKVMVSQLIGVTDAAELAQQEVDIALKSVGEATSRIRVNFQLIAAELIKGLKPAIEFIDRLMASIARGFQNMSAGSKTAIAIAIAGLGAIGPLLYAFGLAKTAVATLMGAFFALIPMATTFTAETLTMSAALMRLTKPIVMVGSTFSTSSSRAALFIANLASGTGPVSKMANRVGLLTGVLQKQTTAAIEATAAVQTHKAAVLGGSGLMGANATGGSILGSKVMSHKLKMASGLAPVGTVNATANTLLANQGVGAMSTLQPIRGPRGRMMMNPVKRRALLLADTFQDRALPLGVSGSSLANLQANALSATNDGARMAQARTGSAFTRKGKAGFISRAAIFKQSGGESNFEDALARRITTGRARGISYSDAGTATLRGKVVTPRTERMIAGGGAKTLIGKQMVQVQAAGRAVKASIAKTFTSMGAALKSAAASFQATVASVFTNPVLALKSGFTKLRTTVISGFTRFKTAVVNGFKSAAASFMTHARTLGSSMLTAFRHPIVALKSGTAKLWAGMVKFNTIMTTGPGAGAGRVATFLGNFKVKTFNLAKTITGIGPLRKSVSAAITQYRLLAAQNQALGLKGKFLAGASSVKTFVMSMMRAVNIMKVFKIVMMGMGIIGIISAAVAVIFVLINSFKNLGSSGDGAKKSFKEAFTILKDVLKMVIKPFKDLIKTFMDLMAGSVGTQKQFETFGDKAKKVATAVKDFFEKYIVPALNFLMVGAANQVRGIVKVVQGFINIFKGDWKKGLFQILQGLVLFVGVAVKLIIKLGVIWIQAYGFLYKKIIEIVAGIARGMGDLMGAAIKWIIMKFHDLVKTLTGFMKHIPGLKQIREMVLSGVEAAADGLDAAFSGMGKLIGGIADGMGGLLDGIQDTAVKALNGLGALAESGFDKIIESTKKLSNSAGKDLVDDAEEFGKEYADVFTTPLASGLDEIIDNASGALKEMLDDLKQKFVDLVLGEIAEKVTAAVEQLKSALESQRDAALAVFDTQIETLDKLAKAEESLTKEKEYQADRRRMIDERALQAQNYVRNRALAIYEGRIDDARMLNLEDQKNNIDFQSSLSKTDEARRKDLAQENLEALKEAISKAKAEANKFFDDQVKAFEDAAKAITKFPPQTIEEYETQLGQLNTIAGTIATENGVIFQGMLEKMKTDIKLPNEGVGVFATSLDALVVAAKEKYGLTDTAADNSIIGATIGMLAGISGQIVGSQETITTAFSGIVTDVFDVASGFSTIATGIVEPAMLAIEQVLTDNNPFTVFETAIKNANTTLLREITGTVGAVGSLVDGLATKLDPIIQKLATINFFLKNPPTTPDTTPDTGGGGTPGGQSGSAPSSETYGAIFRQIKADIAAQTNAAFTILNPAEKLELAQTSTNIILGVFLKAMGKTDAAKKAFYKLEMDKISDPLQRTIFNNYFNVGGEGYANGGFVRGFGKGGYNVPGFNSQPIPAMLHGGEYVVNSKAVSNVGMATLSMLNDMRFKKPNYDAPVSNGGGSSHVTTTNIYVDNFIGEDKWFQEMLKQYNMNVLPNNQKSAGMENRVVKSYSGLARGM